MMIAFNRIVILTSIVIPLLTSGTVLGQDAGVSAAPSIRRGTCRTISFEGDRYHGWPTLLKLADDRLMVVCSGGRHGHVCPFGRVDLIESSDGGKNWTAERTIIDGPTDDRDAGLMQTRDGTLLVSTFTSFAYEEPLRKAIAASTSTRPLMPQDQLDHWMAVDRRIPKSERAAHLGCFMSRSTDGGRTWSPAYRIPVNSPHGPIALSDGTLFYAGVALWSPERTFGTSVSKDDGMTWSPVRALPVRKGDLAKNYHELHAVQAADGRLVIQLRNHNSANHMETLQLHSKDQGKTWVGPYQIGVWGVPSQLIRLSDDRLLMTYGHRRKPLGVQSRISDDHGQTWSPPISLYDQGVSSDLGYPTTAELAPGQFLTVWYERLGGNPNAVLRQIDWEIVQ